MFSRSLTAALVALPFLAQSVVAGDCVRKYTVKAGDICDSISTTQLVSTYQLATINQGVIDNQCLNLQIGQEICLGYEAEDCSKIYVVKSGDTCKAITEETKVSETALYANNPQINDACSNIYIGEVLCVAEAIAFPPLAAGVPVPAATVPAYATPAVPSAARVAEPKVEAEAEVSEEDLPWCDEL